ncbi:GNAT family N-acetyltransferase [Pseudoruegeria sp. HB172150]|uniref:GNAT family N-acetyltransferase n=1 Tax=Pseudoruegeria sp. HB172150 TaxID=2721164 RepID=UPI001557CA61|nr:GNAT family N-acetyltransferase [Pseudoruegeria sp. HB172150]
MDEHILDRPVWSALTTVHGRFATGTGNARRFRSDISPFGAAGDDSEQSLADLGALVTAGGRMVTPQAEDIVCPPGARMAANMPAQQMIYERPEVSEVAAPAARKLSAADAPAMLELATLTNPGPFALHVHLLGEYWGIEQDGRLVAMAGERLKQPGFTELSGVCTHPDYLGRGYARELCLTVLNRIMGRGELPYLHVFSSNTGAIALYEKLGFRVRRTIHVGILEPA